MSDDPNEELAPRVAVLGAGPIGLEAALYARYLGYDVAVFEKGTVAANVARWGHVKMFSPFRMNRSPLGLAALQAQHPDKEFPDNEALLTGREYIDRYLTLLAESDLLNGCVHCGVEVLSIGRDGILKSDVWNVDRSEYLFRLLVRENGKEEIVEADVVIDTTGVYDSPNYLGHGGIPALGELALRDEIRYHIPNVLGPDREQFADKRTLVVGNGYSAATTIVALGELLDSAAQTRVTWFTRRATDENGPIPFVIDDQLTQRDGLARAANALCRNEAIPIVHFGLTSLLSVARENGEYVVTHAGGHTGESRFDQIVANVGFHPNNSIYGELQADEHFAIQGPRKLGLAIIEAGHVDCLKQHSMGVETLSHPEPNFYQIGSKAYGRNSNFLLAIGLEQIREIFALIAERNDLDLYKTMEHFVP